MNNTGTTNNLDTNQTMNATSDTGSSIETMDLSMIEDSSDSSSSSLSDSSSSSSSSTDDSMSPTGVTTTHTDL